MSKEVTSFLQQLKAMFTGHEKNMFEYHKKFFEDYNRLSMSILEQRSAKKIVNIIEGHEYTKEKFFNIHCVKPNINPCVIMTEHGEVTFPSNSFVQGAMYPINILMLKDSGQAEFIGYIN